MSDNQNDGGEDDSNLEVSEIFEGIADSFGRIGQKSRCGLLACCLSFMAIIVICAVSIEGVEPTEFAIIRNNVN